MTVRAELRRALALGAAAIGLAAAIPYALAQVGTPLTLFIETLKVDEEPGRIAPEGEEGLSPAFRRQTVYFRTDKKPGTIHIKTRERFLYLVLGNNVALRYGIGVGRQGFEWSGLMRISRKAEWPDWRPPPEMIARQPYLPRFMAGGPGNPLGARALYLGDTVYRIHGTNQPHTIGHAVSSGCFRMINADVIDLHDRVPLGSWVIIDH